MASVAVVVVAVVVVIFVVAVVIAGAGVVCLFAWFFVWLSVLVFLCGCV